MFGTPSSRSISRLKARSAIAAHFEPAGCGQNTAVFPAEITLIALLDIVGIECVAGNAMPITPHGARSIRQTPVVSARISLRIASHAQNLFDDLQLLDLMIEQADLKYSSISGDPSRRRFLFAHALDDLDGLAAIRQAQLRNFQLRDSGRLHRFIHSRKHAIAE